MKPRLNVTNYLKYRPAPWKWIGLNLFDATDPEEEKVALLATTMMDPVLMPVIERIPAILAELEKSPGGVKILEEIGQQLQSEAKRIRDLATEPETDA